MSYAFDVQARAWSRFREATVDRVDWYGPHLFEMLFSEMHSANHRLDDQVNKDPGVGKAARELEEWLEKEEEGSE